VTRLTTLDPERRHLLLTEERFLHSSLNLIQDHSPLSPGAISATTEIEAASLRRSVDAADVILYTFSRYAQVKALSLTQPVHELIFDISCDSIAKLRDTFPPFDPAIFIAREPDAVP
jgi:hypothetical protein